jgi:hypothetical protein
LRNSAARRHSRHSRSRSLCESEATVGEGSPCLESFAIPAGGGNRLEFQLELDQSFLASTLEISSIA